MRHFLIPALLASAAFGQTITRTYTFTHVDTVQEFQEIANLMRTMAEIRVTLSVNAQKSLTVTATPEQAGVADWLFQQFDQPKPGQGPVTYAVSKDDVMELFYIPSAKTVQDFQELANGVRTLVEIKRATAENAQRAFVMRGTPAQIAQTEWMIDDLTQPTHAAAAHQYQLAADDVTQIFYLTHTASVQNFQEIANAIRTIGEIRQLVAENTPRALIVRGTPIQIAMSAWLVNELDQPQTTAAGQEYQVAPDDLIHVFYLAAATSVQDFQSTANRIRTATQVRRAVATNAQRAFVIRASPLQVSQAEQMLK